MGRTEAGAHLLSQLDGQLHFQRASFDEVLNGRPAVIRHGDVRLSTIVPNLEHRADVGVIKG